MLANDARRIVDRVMGQHRLDGEHCSCGFRVPATEPFRYHVARMVANAVAGVTRFDDSADIAFESSCHIPSLFQVRMHQARREPLCALCDRWLENFVNNGG